MVTIKIYCPTVYTIAETALTALSAEDFLSGFLNGEDSRTVTFYENSGHPYFYHFEDSNLGDLGYAEDVFYLGNKKLWGDILCLGNCLATGLHNREEPTQSGHVTPDELLGGTAKVSFSRTSNNFTLVAKKEGVAEILVSFSENASKATLEVTKID